LIINYFRLASRIVLVLLILSPAPARGLEDKIVFVFKHNGTPEVFLVEGLDGRPIQLTQDMFARWPSISPDGTEVVFVSNPPHGISNIFKLHIAKGKIEILTNNFELNTEFRYLDWSPDGR
jgi:Tol biopolymer transport system component